MFSSDRTISKALGGPKMLFFALYDQMRKFTEFPKSINLIDTVNLPIADIDINLNGKKIVYTLEDDNELMKMDIKSNASKVSFDGVSLASKIAHEWITGNTYTVHHADGSKVKINVCKMETRRCVLI
jgi:hypothetical protein